jgi:hypothetical protein
MLIPGIKLRVWLRASKLESIISKRIIHPLILTEIRRLRLEVCPNMGKAKIKKYIDILCLKNNLPLYSESKIGRIIKDKKSTITARKYRISAKLS